MFSSDPISPTPHLGGHSGRNEHLHRPMKGINEFLSQTENQVKPESR